MKCCEIVAFLLFLTKNLKLLSTLMFISHDQSQLITIQSGNSLQNPYQTKPLISFGWRSENKGRGRGRGRGRGLPN
jgi:hypothetical protein